MNDAPEQQVRLLRAGDWMRKTFGWDGTKAGMTDKMLEKTQIMLNNNRGSNIIPTDVKELLNSSNSTASHFRDVVSQLVKNMQMIYLDLNHKNHKTLMI